MIPSSEFYTIPQKKIEPRQIEVKTKPQTNSDINIKVIKTVEQEKLIEKMSIDERNLLRDQLRNRFLDIKGDAERENLTDELSSKREVPLISKRIEIGEDRGKTNFGGEEDKTGEFNRKKIPNRFRYEKLHSNKPIFLNLIEESGKITFTAVRVWIDSNGKVIKAEVYKSSGYIELDQLALDSIKKRDFAPSSNEPMRIAVIEIDFTNIR